MEESKETKPVYSAPSVSKLDDSKSLYGGGPGDNCVSGSNPEQNCLSGNSAGSEECIQGNDAAPDNNQPEP